jgi:hypothetical protein
MPNAYPGDRLASTISGPQEGIYTIHPNHINVKLPKDCNDDDLALDDSSDPSMSLQPTSMTFFLERVRLAHLCREMADIVPLETNRLPQMPYDNIIALDQKLLAFISSLPFFYKLDPESRQRSKPLEAMYPHIPLARYCITSAAHSRRCKLHQRFLLRQSSDPRYTYSRRACLESARAAIHFYDGLSGDGPPWMVAARMGMAVHYMHLALVVLVMDLCFNRDETDEAEVKAEVKAGLQMFEDTQHVSPLLGQFLTSLRQILYKHNVSLSLLPHPNPNHLLSTTTTTTTTTATPAYEPGLYPYSNTDTGTGTCTFANPSPNTHQHQPNLDFSQTTWGNYDPPNMTFDDTSFDEIWQTAVQGEPVLDMLAWDGLFSSLDSRPL